MLRTVPIHLKEANKLVTDWHRHHKAMWGAKFAIGLFDDETENLVGAAICGRPVNRTVDQNMVLEVTRLVSDGTKNACSKLYAACARAAKAMGYWKIQTYILKDEPGTSLKAAGWLLIAQVRGRPWTRDFNKNEHPLVDKTRWELMLNPEFDFDQVHATRIDQAQTTLMDFKVDKG